MVLTSTRMISLIVDMANASLIFDPVSHSIILLHHPASRSAARSTILASKHYFTSTHRPCANPDLNRVFACLVRTVRKKLLVSPSFSLARSERHVLASCCQCQYVLQILVPQGWQLDRNCFGSQSRDGGPHRQVFETRPPAWSNTARSSVLTGRRLLDLNSCVLKEPTEGQHRMTRLLLSKGTSPDRHHLAR